MLHLFMGFKYILDLFSVFESHQTTQDSFVERLNRTHRNKILDLYIFNSLKEVRKITEKWIK